MTTSAAPARTEIGIILAPGVYQGDNKATSPTNTASMRTVGAAQSRFEEAQALRRGMATHDTIISSTARSTTLPRAVAPTTYEAVVKKEGAGTSVCLCRHSEAEETCYAVRTAAAERALRTLQRENDSLKRQEVQHLARQREMQDAADALKAELEAMGRTVARQTVTLAALSAEMQRRDPYHLVKDRRTAETLAAAAKKQAEEELEALRADHQRALADGASKAKRIEELERQLERAHPKPTPEIIDRDGDDVAGEDANPPEAEQRHHEALREFYDALAALNHWCDVVEADGGEGLGKTTSEGLLSPDRARISALVKVRIRVLSCFDLPHTVSWPVCIVIRGPFLPEQHGDSALAPVLLRTANAPGYASQDGANLTCPFFTEDDANTGVFRCRRGTAWRLLLEVRRCSSADLCVSPDPAPSELVGCTTVPVAALLSTSLLGKHPQAAATSACCSSFHTTPLYEGPEPLTHVVGSICFEVAVTAYAPLSGQQCVSTPVPQAAAVARPTPASELQPAVLPSATSLLQAKAEVQVAKLKEPTPEDSVVSQCARESSAFTAVGMAAPEESAASEDDEKNNDLPATPPRADFVLPPPPPAVVPPPPPQEPLKASGEGAVSCAQGGVGTPPPMSQLSATSITIYVKEGRELQENSCPDVDAGVEETLEDYEGGGNIHVRVLVGGASRYSLCAAPASPGNRKSLSHPRWPRDKGEFVTVVNPESNDDISFEIDCINSYGGVSRLGTCSVKVADVLASPGEQVLTVLSGGQPCGTLVVDFAHATDGAAQ